MNVPQIDAGGLVTGMSRDGKRIYCRSDDTHTLTVGATRCGKTRNVVLPSICVQALAGENMVIVDPKSELYLYTYPYLERLGYEVVTLDFKYPQKSNQYNFLQPVIDAINIHDQTLAITRARDIATILVPERPETHTDPIWINGERSVLTTAILAVVVDNVQRPEYQNLGNVYRFVVEMGRPIGKKGELPLNRYLAALPENHPAKIVSGISQVAPDKTRGSFFASAGSTINIFADPAIHSMTSMTDFDYFAENKKRAIFISLPDHKATYYAIAALFVYQLYQTLVDSCERYGGRLRRRMNFVLDEFGNFVKIPDFDKFLTVGGGRGIRFHLFLQDFSQLDERYGDKVARTLRSNAETWVYMQTDNSQTLDELSKMLGKYTVRAGGQSSSLAENTKYSSSASYNLTGRDLLTADEIRRIPRPYQLVLTRLGPRIMYAPDLSQTPWDDVLGLGDPEHNSRVMLTRNARREDKEIRVSYWGIWNLYTAILQ